MSRWHNIRIRGDLYRVLEAQAVQQSRSTTGQLDFVLSRALEQEAGEQPRGASEHSLGEPPSPARASDGALERKTNTSASSGGGRKVPGESARGEGVGRSVEPSSPSVRASDEKADGEAGAGKVSHRPSPSSMPRQTTVDEMLASCPQCAGELGTVDVEIDGRMRGVPACLECGFVREPEGT